jgi:hypothetical protein
MEETPKERFLRMAKESKNSEDLVCSYLEDKHQLGFHLSPQEAQKIGKEKGWHVPDIQCTKNPKTTIEVKEDLMCGKTGNLAFEEHCLARLKLWASSHNKSNMFLSYVNHKDYRVDYFKCGHDVDFLKKELEWLCAYRIDCKEVQGGDQGYKLWIIPLAVARTMKANVTKSIMNEVDLLAFSYVAKKKLQRK